MFLDKEMRVNVFFPFQIQTEWAKIVLLGIYKYYKLLTFCLVLIAHANRHISQQQRSNLNIFSMFSDLPYVWT